MSGFGTRLRVTHPGNRVKVVINDGGPYHGKRDLDLPAAAVARIGLKLAGVENVAICSL